MEKLKKHIQTFCIVIVGVIFLYMMNKYDKNKRRLKYENHQKTEYAGVVDSVWKDRASIYSGIKCEKGYFKERNVDFTGNLRQYLEIGDSVKKESNSLDILVIKPNGEKMIFIHRPIEDLI